MIHHIIQMLSIHHHHGQSELIEIAKGKYTIRTDIKGVYKLHLRHKRPFNKPIVTGKQIGRAHV